jgi:dienelactone hydrolase
MAKVWVSVLGAVAIVLFVFAVSAQKQGMVTKEITYKADGTALKGYLAYNGSSDKKRPGILVVPEWWGLNDYPRMRAQMLAKLGYVALAVDMYGDGKVATTPDSAGKLAQSVMKDPALLKARFTAALNELRQQPAVDTGRIAAIGYCFGGGVVLDAALLGFPLDGVVSFHGSLGNLVKAQKGDIQAKVLVCNGADDPFNPPQTVNVFKKEMDAAGANYKFIDYPKALHAFTNPAADSVGKANKMPIAYNKAADQKSWKDMEQFLNSVFGK